MKILNATTMTVRFFKPGFLRAVLLLIMKIPFFVSAQAPSIVWEHSLGGEGIDMASCVQQTLDGGYIISGTSYSTSGDIDNHLGDGDCWIVKLDASGGIMWQKSYGGSEFDNAKSVKEISDGGYVFAGITASNNRDVVGFHGLGDAWVVKIDNSGNILWSKCLGGTDIEMASAIELTGDGGFIIAGYTQSSDGDVTGYHGGEGKDFWVVRLNDTGGVQWQKTYGGTKNDIAYDIISTTDGGYIVGGYAQSTDGDVILNMGMADAWVLKLDDTGGIQWQKTYGGTNVEVATSLRQTLDGGYIIGCQTFSNDGDIISNHGEADVWLIKVDDTGAVVWNKTYGGSTDDNIGAIQITKDNGYIIGGSTASHDGDVTGMHDTTDYWVVKLDEMGSIEWNKCLGGSLFDFGTYIVQCADSTYVVVGTSSSTDEDISGGHGLQDYWVVKLGEATNVTTLTHDIVKVYPTLTNRNIYLDMPPEYEYATITFMNVMSQIVPFNITGQLRKTIELPPELTEGLYILRIQNESHQLVYKILVTR